MSERKPVPSERWNQVGLALAGGAPEGAIYEIGALKALDEAIPGLGLDRLGVYVGVSAGAFFVACLANGLSTDQMCRAIVKPEPGEHPFTPEIFFRPAGGEILRRLSRAPRLLAGALAAYASRRERRLMDALTVLGRSLPVGFFDNAPVGEYVHKIFSIKGRSDDFRDLDALLAVVATDLETGASTVFGTPGWDDVPISRAIQASSALPGLYPPVAIGGRHYVDGVLRKTMHASVALEAGAELVFAINPLVPVNTRQAAAHDPDGGERLVDRGLPAVLSQAVRTMIHSRMTLGLEAYETRFPNADVVLIEPRSDATENFFSNIFSFASRRDVCERAYQETRRDLLARRDELEPVLGRHGLALDVAGLEDASRDLWTRVGLPSLKVSRPRRSRSEVFADLDGVLARLEREVGAGVED